MCDVRCLIPRSIHILLVPRAGFDQWRRRLEAEAAAVLAPCHTLNLAVALMRYGSKTIRDDASCCSR